ncbi:MAG: SPFH domain-containing protein [bacterium]|nr:SPFH domain-containing protein [bacterium]
MEIVIFVLGILVGAAVFLLSAAISIPTAHYGVVVRFNERTGRFLNEGLNFIWPFIEKALIYSYELRTDPLEAEVFSKDRQATSLKGSIQWRPDFKNLRRFVEIPENTILVGLKDAIKSEIGKIAGAKDSQVFISERPQLEVLINSIFRLERPPHLHLNFGWNEEGYLISVEMGDSMSKWIQKVQKCVEALKNRGKAGEKKAEELSEKLAKLSGAEWKILPVKNLGTEEAEWDVLRFYELNAPKVKIMLEIVDEEDEQSLIEALYGINISIFRIADVDFAEATKKAMEQKKQIGLRIEAAKQQQKWKLEIMDELIAKGLDAEKASNAADVLMGIATPRQVISIEGGNVLPLMNITPQQKGGK